MPHTQKFPSFGRKISELLILEEIKELFSFGFKDITLFKKHNEFKIDYYFSNLSWEKIYLESNLYSTDPCVEVFFKTNSSIIPWVSLSQKELLLRKKTCCVETGLSIISKKDPKIFLMGHLGGDEKFVTTLLSSQKSLETLFLTFQKISKSI